VISRTNPSVSDWAAERCASRTFQARTGAPRCARSLRAIDLGVQDLLTWVVPASADFCDHVLARALSLP
jgi:hypothetical protein